MLLPYLAGLASGASETYGKIAEEKRTQQAANTKLVADSIQKRLENDDTLTPDEHLSLQGQLYDILKVPPKVKEGLLAHGREARMSYDEHQRQQKTQQVSQPMAPVEDAAAPQGLGDLPVQTRTGQGGFAPPVPAYQPQSIGDITLPQKIRQTAAVATATARAQRDAQLDMLDAEDEYKFKKIDEIDQRVKSGELTPEAGMQRKLIIDPKLGSLEAKPSTRPQFVPGTIKGSSLPADAVEFDGETPINRSPGAEYRVRLLPDKTKEYYPSIAQSTAKVLPDKDSTTGWSRFNITRTGDIVGKVPNVQPDPAYAEHVRNGTRYTYIDLGNEKVEVALPNQNTNQATFPGAPNSPNSSGPLPPIPQAPGQSSVPGIPIPPSSSASPRSFKKTLTPNQTMNTESSVAAIDRGAAPMVRMRDNVDILNNPLIAQAIHFQADPHTGAIATKLSGEALNQLAPADQERAKQFAADVVAAIEDVNKIRGTYGATAFRGPEGFNAMVAQVGAGRLQMNPDVLKKILTKTIEDLRTFRNIQAKRVGVAALDTYDNVPTNTTLNTPIPGTKVDYKEGSDVYHIPAEKTTAFEKAHPNAKRVVK